MRHAVHALILLSAVAGSVARASPDPVSAIALRPPVGSEVSRLFARPADQDLLGPSPRGSTSSWGQDSRKTVFKVHPLATVGGLVLSAMSNGTMFLVPMEMEFALAPSFSVTTSATPMFLSVGYTSGVGLGLGGGLRGYFSGNAPDGFWLGAELQAALVATGYSGAIGVDLQPQLGYQWVLDNGFTIGVGGGLSIGQLAAGKPSFSFQVPIGYAW
jgi:hypothetical protein